MEAGDLATWVGAVLTGVGFGFTAVQLWELRKQQAKEQRRECDGVAVTWHPFHRGTDTETEDGLWKYEIKAHNPGSLPIRNVNVQLKFPCPVVRTDTNGGQADTKTLSMGTPVLMGGQMHLWERHVRFPIIDRDKLRDMEATITFRDLDGQKRTNTWQGGSDDNA